MAERKGDWKRWKRIADFAEPLLSGAIFGFCLSRVFSNNDAAAIGSITALVGVKLFVLIKGYLALKQKEKEILAKVEKEWRDKYDNSRAEGSRGLRNRGVEKTH